MTIEYREQKLDRQPVALIRQSVLMPDKLKGRPRSLFNPAFARDESTDILHLYPRLVDHQSIPNDPLPINQMRVNEKNLYISRLGHLISRDGGRTWEQEDDPIITYDRRLPQELIEELQAMERNSVEDFRVTKIDGNGKLHGTVAVLRKLPFTPGNTAETLYVESDDLHTLTIRGRVTPLKYLGGDHRAATIYSEKFFINGAWYYGVFHRPQQYDPVTDTYVAHGSTPGKPKPAHLQFSFAKTPMELQEGTVILYPMFPWERWDMEPGPPAIKTRYGQVVIFNEVGEKDEIEKIMKGAQYFISRDGARPIAAVNPIRVISAALFHPENPTKLIGRLPYPILVPEETYELRGDAKEACVFGTGAINLLNPITRGKVVRVAFGAGDTASGFADCYLDDLVDALLFWTPDRLAALPRK